MCAQHCATVGICFHRSASRLILHRRISVNPDRALIFRWHLRYWLPRGRGTGGFRRHLCHWRGGIKRTGAGGKRRAADGCRGKGAGIKTLHCPGPKLRGGDAGVGNPDTGSCQHHEAIAVLGEEKTAGKTPLYNIEEKASKEARRILRKYTDNRW